METRFFEDYTELRGAEDFDPVKIFECGQCFRWNADENGVYTGVHRGRAASVEKRGDTVYLSGGEAEFRELWESYFDLSRDYGEIRRKVSVDDYMRRASDFGAGIRILRQDRWEAACSFIISQCNNIPRIKKIIETLCLHFGEPVEFRGRTYHSFPSAETVAELTPEELAPLRCGYRAPYIVGAARAVADGTLDLDGLAKSSYAEALKALKSLNGIGDKVANCIILFGLQMPDAFPIDVWMKRALAEHYGSDFTPAIFGEWAGVAQQYMFYYARSGEK